MGIKNMKTVLGFIIGLGERVDKVTAEDSSGGKKITGVEWMGSIGLLTGVPALIKALPKLKDEFNDLDDTEREELKQYVKTEFDIENDKLELLIEKAFDIALELSKIADLFKKDS